jgi:hypothetical protein
MLEEAASTPVNNSVWQFQAQHYNFVLWVTKLIAWSGLGGGGAKGTKFPELKMLFNTLQPEF